MNKVIKVKPQSIANLRRSLIEKGGVEEKGAVVFGSFKVVLYRTGTILVQGRKADKEIVELIRKTAVESEFEVVPYIGGDEAGRGDFFGPMVGAVVLVDNPDKIPESVRDSKKMSEAEIFKVDEEIRNNLVFSVEAIEPVEYNQKSLSGIKQTQMLKELYKNCINSVLERTNLEKVKVIIDAFTGKEEKLPPEKFGIISERVTEVETKIRGEDEFKGIAAASIVARAEFLRWIKKTESMLKINVPMGAGENAYKTALHILNIKGKEEAKKFVKFFGKLKHVR